MISAEASPNIAFVKYWGKLPAARDEDRNLAVNPSLSMTLRHARTRTSLTELPDARAHEIFINGAPATPADHAKVSAHIQRVRDFAQAVRASASLGLGADSPTRFYRVRSDNNFPAGTGIASSASAFAALTLAALGAELCDDGVKGLGEKVDAKLQRERIGVERAMAVRRAHPVQLSALARRGSGSAARSLDGGFVHWRGDGAERIAMPTWKLYDFVVIFSREHKKVPSSDGHAVALSSPLFADRLARLPARSAAIEDALRARDLTRLGPLLEAEALELHAIARSGQPPIDYLLPGTRSLMEALGPARDRDFFFTLDAGPNVHVLSERDVESELRTLLDARGLRAEIWRDETGEDATLRAHSADDNFVE